MFILIVIAAFKQQLAVLLYRCFTLAKVCSAFAVHDILCWLLERLTSTALATLKCHATKKVNSCSAVSFVRVSRCNKVMTNLPGEDVFLPTIIART